MLPMPTWLRVIILSAGASFFLLLGLQFALSSKFNALPDQAEQAFVDGRFAEARELADEALSLAPVYYGNWNRGNAIHAGHSVLGLVALEAGDVAAARDELLAAGATPGSPQLDSFGPDFSLAQALADRGEHACVSDYLAQCRSFWDLDDGRLDAWTADLAAGRSPDFDRKFVERLQAQTSAAR